LVIELLAKHHDCDNFHSREPEMNDWLRKHALKNARLDICRTFVLVECKGDKRIVAYYALSTGHIRSTDIPKVVPPSMAIPVLMLHRIAVDEAYKGRKIGERLITHIQIETERLSQEVGLHALVLEPLRPELVPYYQALHFKPMDENAKRMYITVKQIRAVLCAIMVSSALDSSGTE
jgi:predicted N-acetyltransferase YhbS